MASLIQKCEVSDKGDLISLAFHNEGSVFTFHSQWLHDARCDHGSSRVASQALCERPGAMHIENAAVSGSGAGSSLNIQWSDGTASLFPAIWLRALAPTVAKSSHSESIHDSPGRPKIPTGWLAKDLAIPEISYQALLGSGDSQSFVYAKEWILDTILRHPGPGIVKITDLPAVDVYQESTQRNNLLTSILKTLFGAVFQHPMRGSDETFKVTTHYHEDAKRAVELPNYATGEVLLPHTDHSHYHNPVHIQGLHAVQGTSENTFVDSFAVLQTLLDERPDLYDALRSAPMILGRVAQFYSPPLVQTAVDVAVRTVPGFPDQVRGVRWHPHLTGYLLTPFGEFERAREAHCKFQEIMRRNTHMVRTLFRSGDLYLWNNFRLLHGREATLESPRLAIGQTVTEQVVSDEYRRVMMRRLGKHVGQHWLVQTPLVHMMELERAIADLKC